MSYNISEANLKKRVLNLGSRFTGIKHKEETKRKIGDKHKGKITSKETIRKREETRRKGGWFHNPEKTKMKMQINNSGKGNPMFGKPCPKPYRIKYKGLTFRSSWEVIVANWLDKKGYNWSYEPYRFYFVDKGISYLPDFYVKELNCYIEVKGRYTKDCINKITAFQEEFPEYKLMIIDKSNIGEYKL